MQAGYTCLRCLGAQAAKNACQNSSRIRATKGTRWISTSGKPTPRLYQQAHKTVPTSERKYSLSQHGERIQTESVEVPQSFGSAQKAPSNPPGRVLQSDNLFHPFSDSPSPVIRRRAAFLKQHAFCPHPNHHITRLPTLSDPDARKPSSTTSQPPAHVNFECPDCGIPVYCSENHWADDYEAHLEICDTLREVNEDDHDLRSGRFFTEFGYPGPQIEEFLVNLTNWDTYLYSREYQAINEPRSMRQATRMLTYPVTIGSFLHELSPYSIRRGGRLTVEGLKSLSGTYPYLFLPSSPILTMKPSPPLHPPPTPRWLWSRHCRSPP